MNEFIPKQLNQNAVIVKWHDLEKWWLARLLIKWAPRSYRYRC